MLLLLALAALAAVSAQSVCRIDTDGIYRGPRRDCCHQLFELLNSDNSVRGRRDWCVGDTATGRCCVSWTRDCGDRTWKDVLAKAQIVSGCIEMSPPLWGTSDKYHVDSCLGHVCVSNRPECPYDD